MTDAERAAKMKELGEKLVTVIAEFGDGATEIGISTGALGVCCGVLAVMTGSPEKFMSQVGRVAAGIISGELVD